MSRGHVGNVDAIPPARFSDPILEAVAEMLDRWEFSGAILDPFAGTGGVHRLATPTRTTLGIELQPEWAATHERTLVGSALAMDLPDGVIDSVVTSPCYGNRLADRHKARDGSRRRSYTHDLRRMTGNSARELHPDNAGALHWGSAYRGFHRRAWAEVHRVLRPEGLLVLNISDHIRRGKVVPVTDWHLKCLSELGFALGDRREVATRRLRSGANRSARVTHETIALLLKEGQ